MTTRATISHADELYHGDVHYANYTPDGRRGVILSHLVAVSLGSPTTQDTDGICDGVTCSTTAATAITLLTDTLDVPRNLIVDSSDSTEVDGVVTITGADEYGEVMVEKITANGTTAVSGKKAFKTLTSISVAACTAAGTIDIGWGNVLGLPYRVDAKKDIYSPQADGSVEDFTVVVADTDQDATSGDCRGTYTPATTPNNVVEFSCLIHLDDFSTKEAVFGYDQYAG
jgi:hypothetical protein